LTHFSKAGFDKFKVYVHTANKYNSKYPVIRPQAIAFNENLFI